MNNKVKILRYIAMNGPQSMDQLTTRQSLPEGRITDQTRGAFKQYIYQLKNNGDLDQGGGKYVLTPKAESYLRAINEMPRTDDLPDDARLDVCTDCQKVVNLEKHQCPNGDPLAGGGEEEDQEPEPGHHKLGEGSPPEDVPGPDDEDDDDDRMDKDDEYRPSASTANEKPEPPMNMEKLSESINSQKRDFDEQPVGSGVFIEFDELDLEIDCMRSLMLIMTRFEREGLERRQRRRITEWFADRFGS